MATTSKVQFIERYGHYGRQVPLTFNFALDGTHRIKTITLSTGSVVDGLGFEIADQHGASKKEWYGGRGHESTTIYFKDTEYITQISGSYGNFVGDGNNIDVARIYIHTNLAPNGYGPYGRMQDCTNIKSFKAPDSPSVGRIVGFFGSTGICLQSLGISVRKAEPSIQRYGQYGRHVPLTFNLVIDRTDRIKTITLSTGSVVDGLGFKIVNQSGSSKSVWYGGQGHESATINFKDTEYITQISGSYGNFIYIHTNLAPNGYGPYGRRRDCSNIKSFKVPDSPSAGRIVGFFGATGICLQSLGISVRKDS